MSSKASLLEAAGQLAEAERRGDVQTLEQLVAADYVGYDPAGREQNRARLTRAYVDGMVRITSLGQREVQARVIGEAGLVTGVSAFRGTQGVSGESFDFTLRFLDVYAWRDGRWQLVASQDTRLPW